MTQRSILLGTGHFGWPKAERQNDTWARVLLSDPHRPEARRGEIDIRFDRNLAGHTGRLVARVVRVTDRPASGAPCVGQEFDLGTGRLALSSLDERSNHELTTLGLEGHTFDSDMLYHLHTHWVELRLEAAR